MMGLGGRINNTPFISEFAEKSVDFTRCKSPSSWTLPSHISMFTGYPQPKHNFRESENLGEENSFVSNLPSCYESYLLTSNPYLGSVCNINKSFDNFYGCPDNIPEEYVKDKELNQNSPNGFYYADKFKQEISDSKGNEPWFAYINLMDEHQPYQPLTEYRNRSDDDQLSLQKKLGGKWDIEYYSGERDVSELNELKNLYKDCIRQLDSIVEDIILSLNKGERENTNIIILGDHGEGFGNKPLENAPISVSHGLGPFESIHNVPLIVNSAENNQSKNIEGLATLTNLGDVVSSSISQDGYMHQNFREDIVLTGTGRLQEVLHQKWKNSVNISDYESPHTSAYTMENDIVLKEIFWGDRKWTLSDYNVVSFEENQDFPSFQQVDVSSEDDVDEDTSSDVEERLDALGYK
jgi:arylsulfatase/arylsulfatase A